MRQYNPPMSPLFKIIHQDDDIMVLDKQSGILSVPGKSQSHKDSLYKRVLSIFPTAHVVHRLDLETSGIMLIPLNKPALSNIARQFQSREIAKTYIADIFGKPKHSFGTVDLPLRCDWPNRPRQMVCYDQGKPSQTHYKVLYSNNKVSRVRLTPITGRSHQLRVHMKAIGHPIIGDPLYAHEQALSLAPRLHLHAYKLTLRHPCTSELLTFVAAAPF